MEFALALWISKCKKKNISLCGNIIHKKALKLYQQFDRGNRAKDTPSAYKESTEMYLETFRQIIKNKEFKPEQALNMDDTGLFWEKMPSRSYIMKDKARAPEFKA